MLAPLREFQRLVATPGDAANAHREHRRCLLAVHEIVVWTQRRKHALREFGRGHAHDGRRGILGEHRRERFYRGRLGDVDDADAIRRGIRSAVAGTAGSRGRADHLTSSRSLATPCGTWPAGTCRAADCT